MPQDVHDLIVWRRAIELAIAVYKLTQHFPKEDIYGLTLQMERASVSVASNIAEGRGRLNPAEFRQFLGQSSGLAVRTANTTCCGSTARLRGFSGFRECRIAQ